MKCLLLTIWHERNYGAELQAYATIKFLQELGHDVKMIDIRLSDKDPVNIKTFVIRLIESLTPSSFKFNRFWKKYIPTTERYKNREDLENRLPEADLYIVGSDQVWNPDITKNFYDIYFFSFLPDDKPRISIASSFGVEDWSKKEIENEIKGCLNKFDFISCREDVGIKLLASTFGLKGTQILDPSFLPNNFNELVGSLCSQNHLVYYPLYEDPDLNEIALRVAALNGWKAININKNKKILKKIVWNRPSIETWLKNIAEAKFVITRSFHGLVFSLIFNKQFVVVKGRNDRVNRIESLLRLLGLENRLMKCEEIEVLKPWETFIDFSVISPKLEAIREENRTILSNMFLDLSKR